MHCTGRLMLMQANWERCWTLCRNEHWWKKANKQTDNHEVNLVYFTKEHVSSHWLQALSRLQIEQIKKSHTFLCRIAFLSLSLSLHVNKCALYIYTHTHTHAFTQLWRCIHRAVGEIQKTAKEKNERNRLLQNLLNSTLSFKQCQLIAIECFYIIQSDFSAHLSWNDYCLLMLSAERATGPGFASLRSAVAFVDIHSQALLDRVSIRTSDCDRIPPDALTVRSVFAIPVCFVRVPDLSRLTVAFDRLESRTNQFPS